MNDLYNEIQKENRRIEMLKNTSSIDADFLAEEIRAAKDRIAELQAAFNQAYENDL